MRTMKVDITPSIVQCSTVMAGPGAGPQGTAMGCPNQLRCGEGEKEVMQIQHWKLSMGIVLGGCSALKSLLVR